MKSSNYQRCLLYEDADDHYSKCNSVVETIEHVLLQAVYYGKRMNRLTLNDIVRP